MSGPFVLTYVALWVLVVLQTLILIGVIRALYELRQEYQAAEPPSLQGHRVPNFSAVDLSGHGVSTASLAGEPAALLFVSPNCPSCMVSLAELKALVTDATRGLVVICHAGDDDCRRLAANYRLTVPVVADEDGELMRLFGISGTPMAVRISAHGVIESYGEPARGEDLEELLAGSPRTQEPTSEQTENTEAAV